MRNCERPVYGFVSQPPSKASDGRSNPTTTIRCTVAHDASLTFLQPLMFRLACLTDLKCSATLPRLYDIFYYGGMVDTVIGLFCGRNKRTHRHTPHTYGCPQLPLNVLESTNRAR